MHYERRQYKDFSFWVKQYILLSFNKLFEDLIAIGQPITKFQSVFVKLELWILKFKTNFLQFEWATPKFEALMENSELAVQYKTEMTIHRFKEPKNNLNQWVSTMKYILWLGAWYFEPKTSYDFFWLRHF